MPECILPRVYCFHCRANVSDTARCTSYSADHRCRALQVKKRKTASTTEAKQLIICVSQRMKIINTTTLNTTTSGKVSPICWASTAAAAPPLLSDEALGVCERTLNCPADILKYIMKAGAVFYEEVNLFLFISTLWKEEYKKTFAVSG